MFDGLMESTARLRQNLWQYFGVSFAYIIEFEAKLVYNLFFSLHTRECNFSYVLIISAFFSTAFRLSSERSPGTDDFPVELATEISFSWIHPQVKQ